MQEKCSFYYLGTCDYSHMLGSAHRAAPQRPAKALDQGIKVMVLWRKHRLNADEKVISAA